MDFFSNIGKAFSDTAKKVQQKTNVSIESGKITSEIRKIKAEREKLIIALGETYFENRNNPTGLEQLELITRRIEDMDKSIDELNVQLDAVNGQKRCPACKTVVNADVKFCPACGTAVPTPEPAAKPEPEQPKDAFCPTCGAPRQGEGKFCTVCGASFEAAEEKPEAEINWPEAEQVAEETSEE